MGEQHPREGRKSPASVLAALLFGALIGFIGTPLCVGSLDSTVISVASECINDTSAFDTRCSDAPLDQGWRYAIDSSRDVM